jgi:hypothetical protein
VIIYDDFAASDTGRSAVPQARYMKNSPLRFVARNSVDGMMCTDRKDLQTKSRRRESYQLTNSTIGGKGTCSARDRVDITSDPYPSARMFISNATVVVFPMLASFAPSKTGYYEDIRTLCKTIIHNNVITMTFYTIQYYLLYYLRVLSSLVYVTPFRKPAFRSEA